MTGGIGDPGAGMLAMLTLVKCAGPVDRLESSADALASFGETACADKLRDLARESRGCRAEFARIGCVYDDEKGAVVFPKKGPGAGVDLMTLLISAAFAQLKLRGREHWYTPETYQAVREKLAPFMDAASVASLTDTRIRKVIERRRK